MPRTAGENDVGEKILLLVFRLGEQRYALSLEVVERIVRAVEVTPLPGAPGSVLGAIDVQGCVLPVLSIRRRFGLAQAEIGPDDQFLLARTAQRPVALVIDEAQGVMEHPAGRIINPARIAPGAAQFRGVVQLEDGLALIYDLERFLSMEETSALDEAMGQEGVRAI